jgi:DNA-directed RNA polymerase specialized sigma24 family protein
MPASHPEPRPAPPSIAVVPPAVVPPARVRARRPRPATEALFDAVKDLLSSGSAPFKGTARRYSLCAADAEDAYQRSLEILITKAPTTERSELRPWLHTVIKHEALAIRRQRERLLAGGGEQPESRLEAAPGPEEGASERESGCVAQRRRWAISKRVRRNASC